MYKLPIIIKDDYIVYGEPSKVGMIVHCDVLSPWCKQIKQDLQRDWKQLQMLHGRHRIIALHTPDQGVKHEKFLTMMGFTYSHSLPDVDVWTINGD